MKTGFILKHFLSLVLPNLCFLFLLLALIITGVQAIIEAIENPASPPPETEETEEDPNLVIWLIADILILAPFVALGGIFFPMAAFFGTVAALVSASQNDATLFIVPLSLTLAAVVWSGFYAFFIDMGKFETCTSSWSGSHTELRFEGNKATVHKVNEYESNGEWYYNTWLYAGRLFAVLCGGIFVFRRFIKREQQRLKNAPALYTK